MKLLQINTTVNSGSTGKIAEAIGQLAISHGWESYIAYGRGKPQSESHLIRIGDDWDMRWHGIETRLLDNHGLASRRVTRHFINQIEEINPDIIHLHNIHGYYLNYPLLFDYLKCWKGPVIWTWHDIWPMTGHCAYFGQKACDLWRIGCNNCPRKNVYPKSVLNNRAAKNFETKRSVYADLDNLTIVTVSNWMEKIKKDSFMKKVPSIVIHNGIDLEIFHPVSGTPCNKTYVLAVANVWAKEKGLYDLISLRAQLAQNIDIVIIGLNSKQITTLPKDIKGLRCTQNVNELKFYYSNAIALINPTWGDNFPTINLEALACGTPVITYNTGGSPEAIDANTGIIIDRGDVHGLADAVMKITNEKDKYTSEQCRTRAMTYFDKDVCFKKYFDLYYSLLRQ